MNHRLEDGELYPVEHDEGVSEAHVRDVQTIFTELVKEADNADLCEQFDGVLEGLRDKLTVKPVIPPKKIRLRVEPNDSYDYAAITIEADDGRAALDKLVALLTNIQGVTAER